MNFYGKIMKYKVRIICTFNVNLISATLHLCVSVFLLFIENVVSGTEFAATNDRMFSELCDGYGRKLLRPNWTKHLGICL
jgi:hypothetical protein